MKSLYQRWYDREAAGLNPFVVKLFELHFMAPNEEKIKLAYIYPAFFIPPNEWDTVINNQNTPTVVTSDER